MKTKYTILAVLLIGLFVGAIAVYNRLSSEYTPPIDPPPSNGKSTGKAPQNPGENDPGAPSGGAQGSEQKPSDDVPSGEKPTPDAVPPSEGSVPETPPPTVEETAKNTAPDFTVFDKEGKPVRLSEMFGRPVVINFWATWCPPCKREMPDFEKLYKEYGDRVVFMMVNLTDGHRDTVEGTKRFVSGKGYTFPVYFDTQDSGGSAYHIVSIPQTVFIDRNGNVYKTHIGAMNEATLRLYIDALLGE